jgi:CubicO group peptidase (beta-lactamase class C family)
MIPLVALIAISGYAQQQSSTWLNFQIQKYVEWKTLDDLADSVRKDNKLPGLCLAYQMGDKTEASVTGLRNIQNTTAPIEDDDRLLVGSIGKTMTAVLVARLIEMQKFGWKTPLAEALPNIKMQDAYKTVTIEQLLHHKANLPSSKSFTPLELDKIFAKTDSPTKVREAFVAALLAKDPDDTNSASTDFDYALAGYIAERVIHQPYEWLMERYVFTPMKMSTAMIAPIGSENQVGSERAVQEHIQADFGYTSYAMPSSKMEYALAPAGEGISCSIADLLSFASFNLQGIKGNAKVLTAESYKVIHTPPSGGKSSMGWVFDPSYAGEPCQKCTATNGAFYSEITLWPQSNIAIVAVTNAGTMRTPAPTSIAMLAVKAKLEKKDASGNAVSTVH